jgi:predicted DNA-binding transcriptional regulator AlpA
MTDNDELLDKEATCRFFGGSKPIDPSTLYRGIAAGRYPRPIRISPNISRWLKSECLEVVKRLATERKPEAA